MKDLKLNRQKFALAKVKSVTGEKQKKEYKTQVEGLGMVIYNHNLITAMAWLKSKNNTLFKQIESWLTKKYPMKATLDETNFLKTLTNLSSTQLMVYTEEVLLLSDALKEFAKAEIN